MKNGLFYENDELIYYKDDKPYHAGVIKVDGAIYYISSKGKAVRGEKTVHRERANGLLERGFYTFGEDYKLVEGSFRPVKKQKGYRIRAALHKLKKNKVFKKIFKKKNILPAIAAVCSVWLLALLVQTAQNEKSHHTNAALSGIESESADSTNVLLHDFKEEVLLTSKPAKQLYDHEITVAEALGADPYQPMVFGYDLKGRSGTLLISEDVSFSDILEFTLVKGSAQVVIDNLKTGTTYFYRVLVEDETYEGSFKTAASTRFVSIPGIKNTRDIGGYTTLDGKTVKQGLLIRGLEIDGLAEPTYFIPKEAMEEIQDTFGFVYDFDLRESSLYSGKSYQSRLGDDVGHKFYGAPQYGEIFRDSGLVQVREIFRDLANPRHYPMYFHCTYGTDRTGTMVFLLQGLLGMSEEDMIREYRLTAFFSADLAESDNMDVIIDGMQSYAGDTLQEKIETYFIEAVGLTSAEIESIRSIFLE